MFKYFIGCLLGILFFSCSSQSFQFVDEKGNVIRSYFTNQTQIPTDLCSLLPQEKVIALFATDSTPISKNYFGDSCLIYWENDTVFDYNSNRNKTVIKIANFKKYKSFKNAYIRFDSILNESNNAQFTNHSDVFSENKSVVNHFTPLVGIGDYAYYNLQSKSLNVLFGSTSFSVTVHSIDSEIINIQKAKEIAKIIYSNLIV